MDSCVQEGHLAMTEITSYLFKYVWIDMFSAFRIQQVLVKKKKDDREGNFKAF